MIYDTVSEEMVVVVESWLSAVSVSGALEVGFIVLLV